MTAPAGTFDQLNAAWDSALGKKSKDVTLHALRDIPVMGQPKIQLAQTIRYEKYPGGAPFPTWWIFTLVATIMWNLFDQGKGRWGTSPVSKSWNNLLFNVFLAYALLGMGMDTLITVVGTYEGYGTIAGLEHNGNLRQWGAFMKETFGINFAWAMVLTDIIEGIILFINWYYGRRNRNLVSLISLFVMGSGHWFMGWWTWPTTLTHTLSGLPNFFSQLGGLTREFQGGGPQFVTGVV